ncbi:hypothetical protein HAX54_007401, partial [Datura stramonium]|nr:hypothetical protein [Datura stramonium]
MEPKVNKGKELLLQSMGLKRARRPSEEEHEDVSMEPLPLRRYGLRCVKEKQDVSRCEHEVFPHTEPLNDDVAMEHEMSRVDSDIESSDDDDEDSEMG